jgi:2-dehydro-3-deoxyphosphogluconate aldolase/(4S)-4-hydroxy-2-oxoglutarate aldolase
VVVTPNTDAAVALGRALFEGGVHCLEITMTVPGATDVMRQLRASLGAEALIGAGTVTSDEHARRCIEAGAEFLVSPATLPSLVPLAHAAGIPTALGALTPTEVLLAAQSGSDFVKVFPCSALGGPSYLKALQGPFPDIELFPTGGVTLDTMESYLATGVRVLGVGTALADYKLMAKEGAPAIVNLARRYVEAFNRIVGSE